MEFVKKFSYINFLKINNDDDYYVLNIFLGVYSILINFYDILNLQVIIYNFVNMKIECREVK